MASLYRKQKLREEAHKAFAAPQNNPILLDDLEWALSILAGCNDRMSSEEQSRLSEINARTADVREASDVQTNTLTVFQLWTIIKLMKFGRTYCRNNAALYNFIRECFPEATLTPVKCTNKRTNETYDGIKITLKGETVDQSTQEDDEEG